MGRKAFYIYNPATGHYDRVYPSRGERLWMVARRVMLVLCTASALAAIVYMFVKTPRERHLDEQNRELKARLSELGRRFDEAVEVSGDLARRDDNFYRVIMGAKPLGTGTRAGSVANPARYKELEAMSDGSLIANLTMKAELLENLLAAQSRSFDELSLLASQSRDRLSHIPSIQPIARGHMKQMASGYGYRVDPVYGTSRFHEGLDFSADRGTPVYATAQGRIIAAGWESGYGNVVDIDHGYGYLTRYAHLSKISVKAGSEINRGDLVGEVGSTGKSTGNHLHYEVRLHGVPQNPLNYYFQDITPEEYDELVRQADNAGYVMD